MKIKLILIFTIISSSLSYGQAQVEWANVFGGDAYDVGHTLRVDSYNNTYVAGQFRETVSFDPNSNDYDFTAGDLGDVYLQKFDENGNFLWVKIFSSADSSERPIIEVDQNNNVYISSTFNGTIDLDPGPNQDLRTYNSGFTNVYLVKLNSNGDYVWGNSFEFNPTNQNIDANEIKIDTNGDVLIAGEFQGIVDFNFDDQDEFIIDPTGVSAYLLKIDTDGNFIWVKIFEALYSNIYINALTFDSENNIIAAGAYLGSGSADFDPGDGTFNLSTPNGNNTDLFVLKLDDSGSFIWAKTAVGDGVGEDGQVANERVTSVAVDENDAIYLTGYFRNNIDFEPASSNFSLDAGINGCFNCAGYNTSFFGKMDSDGNMVWLKMLEGGNYYGGVISEVRDYSSGNVLQYYNRNLVVGVTFRGALEYEIDGVSTTYFGESNNRNYAFLQLDPENGEYLSAYVEEHTNANSYLNYMMLKDSDIYVTGIFRNQLFAGSSSPINSNSISQDGFLVKYSNAIILSTEEFLNKNDLKIFPNPTDEILHINNSSVINQISIIDSSGNRLHSVKVKNNTESTIQILVDQLSSGIYLLEIITDRNKQTVKFIKK